MTKDIGENRGRYVYAVDRREVIKDRKRLILDAAQNAGLPAPIVVAIVSDAKQAKHATSSVSTQIAELPKLYANVDHVVAIITHKGMMLSDHSAFDGWEIVIDEDPVMFTSETWNSRASVGHFREFYSLSPFEGELSRIQPYPGAPSVNDYRADTQISDMAEFRRLTEHSTVLTTEPDWEGVKAGKRWTWFDQWNLLALSAYKRVRIVANAFDERLNHRIHTELFPQIQFVSMRLAGQTPVWLPRKVTINFFTDEHQATSAFFATDEGKAYRDAAAAWIAYNMGSKTHHYWVANVKFTPKVKIDGERHSPKVAGLNSLRHCDKVSILYTAKGSNEEVGTISKLTGLHTEEAREIVARDREREDLVQIVLRSSLRDPINTQDVTVTVYDKTQATFLKDFLERSGYGCAGLVTLNHVDIGTNQRTNRQKSGPKVTGTAKTRSEINADYYAKTKAERGSTRSRGRPKKV
ncbi:hypothetical protein [uncultured Aureimonas sp.]|uniref:hypothetical protein n=1 Tax=uncultured Aureimonas sp. TaxID=1604662 RepID=UPI0025FA0B15|nr:hypothetical protein [uncultured Aureimonas sp.]